jgi:hypothetical protein
MLDWEGNMVVKEDQKEVLLSEIPEDTEISAASVIGALETARIEQVLEQSCDLRPEDLMIPNEVSPVFDPERMCATLEAKASESHFKMSIGAMVAFQREYLVKTTSEEESDGEMEIDKESEEQSDFESAKEEESSHSGSSGGEREYPLSHRVLSSIWMNSWRVRLMLDRSVQWTRNISPRYGGLT